MRKINSILACICLIIITLNATAQNAQLTVTAHNNMSATTLVEQYFLGSGVRIDTNHPVKVNGQTSLTSNQIATFLNTDTSYEGRNIPIKDGIVLATCRATNISNSSIGQNANNSTSNYAAYAPMLYSDYSNYCANTPGIEQSSMNDIIALDFWVIPSSFEMSFNYSFASVEYPSYVCSQYNDIFGLYVDGPYDVNGEVSDAGEYYSHINIATIPGTHHEGDEPGEGDKVMINTINAGTTDPKCSAYNGNSIYFIDNQTGVCSTNGFGGYTKKLTTEVVNTVPCKLYHIQIAICNIGDHNFQSAVFLEKGSFNSKMKYIDHKVSLNNDTIENVFLKGCSSDTMKICANYVASSNEQPYHFTVKSSDGSTLARGTDYEYSLIGSDVPISNQVTIPEGQTEVKILLNFLHNEAKAPGTKDTLLFISEDLSQYPCLGTDTIKYILKEPDLIQNIVTGGKTYCKDRLPQKDTINVKVNGSISYAVVSLLKGYNEREPISLDTLRYNYGDTVRQLIDTFIVSAMNEQDTFSYIINIEDSCGRSWDTVIRYTILGTNTQAEVSKEYICQGDSVTLSCPQSDAYLWTSSPTDTTLSRKGQDTTQSPIVFPTKNTSYYVQVTSNLGCKAYDTVKVNVEKLVKAVISLRPKDPKYSDPVVEYKDLSVGTHTQSWDFGDGEFSEEQKGWHAYPVNAEEDTHSYPVMLIVYNVANCPDTAFDTVTVKADFTIYLPNAILSGYSQGDDVSIFQPKGSLLEDWDLSIYNRWGTKVYEGHNKGWDGKLENGDWAPQGTYVYDIMYKDGGTRIQRKTGTLNVIPYSGKK